MRNIRILLLTLLLSSSGSSVAAVNLTTPTVTHPTSPVMVKVMTLSDGLHGSSGKHLEPRFLQSGEGEMIQPPFGVPPFFNSVWVELFHPDYLPITFTTSEYTAVTGVKKLDDIPMWPLDELDGNPIGFLLERRFELDGGWSGTRNPGHYPAALMAYVDAQEASPELLDRYRVYADRYREIAIQLRDVEVMCRGWQQSHEQADVLPSNPLWRSLGQTCNETDPDTRTTLFNEFHESYLADIDSSLRRLHHYFWQPIGRGPEYTAHREHFFQPSGDTLQARPLRDIWSPEDVARLTAMLGTPEGPLTWQYRVKQTNVHWEAEQGLIQYSLNAGGYHEDRETNQRCVGFSYVVDASRYFEESLPDTRVEYREQWLCYDHETESWGWPKDPVSGGS